METRIQRLLLNSAACCLVMFTSLAHAADQNDLFEPQLERREIDESLIDSEDFQLGGYAGVISIEDFGSDFLWGAKLAYHVTEDIFLEANYGSSEAGDTSFEKLSGGAPLLDDRDYTFYLLSVGWNILPGEVFVWDQWAFNGSFYLTGGAGNTEFAGDDNFTLGVGFGYRLLVNDWFAVELGAADYIFDTDITGEDKTTHNLAMTGGLSVFF